MSDRANNPSTMNPLIVLLPTRLFIGLGWLRAAIEKVRDPEWFGGGTVRAFLTTHDGAGFFDSFLAWLFGGDMATFTAAAVYALQVLVGLGIVIGACTSAMLLMGISMNLVFLLSGAPTPSVFYILLQLTLLWSGTGAICGIDRWADARWSPLAVAQPQALERWFSGPIARCQVALGLAISALVLPSIRLMEPKDVIDDAAAMAAFCGLLPTILLLSVRMSHRLAKSTSPA